MDLDPVDGATSYEAEAYLPESGVDEKTLVYPEEPSYRWEGLTPDTEVGIFVRAVRETAGGRAVSEWSDYAASRTLRAYFPPAACSNERELALDDENNPILVHEWDPEQPFRVWIDEESIRMGGLELDRPRFLEEEVLEPLRDIADRIEERLGYSIFDPYDLLRSRPSTTEPAIKVFRYDREPDPEPWDPECAPVTPPPMEAAPWAGEIYFNDPYFFDPAITCGGYMQIRTGETIVHELAHLLGMKHFRPPGATYTEPRGGVPMSEPLTFAQSYGDVNVSLTPEDIDAIGCIFPHPDHPR